MRYRSATEVIDYYIRPALGEYAGDYDLHAIFEEAFTYRVDINTAGEEEGNTAGFELAVDDAEFWEIVKRHEN